MTVSCLRCGHTWLPRTSERPRCCGRCKSPYWDRPPTRWRTNTPPTPRRSPFARHPTPDELWAAAQLAAQVARERRIRHALLGGTAMMLYGSTRVTKDVDFVAAGPLADPRELRKRRGEGLLTFGGHRYVCGRVAVDWINRTDDKRALYEEALQRGVIRRSGMPVLDPTYLAAVKLAAGRARDVQDAYFLLRTRQADPRKLAAILQRHRPRGLSAHSLPQLIQAARADAPDYPEEEEKYLR